MSYKFDDFGNLLGGIIQSDLENLKVNLVDSFASSKTRKRNYDSLVEFFNFLIAEDVMDGITYVWIDGSFCTRKENPNDIDLVILLKPYNDSAKILRKNHEIIRMHFKNKFLDIYMTYDSNYFNNSSVLNRFILKQVELNQDLTNEEIIRLVSESQREWDYHLKYWMGQFGFDREQRSKGIISLEGKKILC